VTHVGQFIGIVLLPGNRGCPNALANDFGFTRTEAKVSGLFLNGYSTKQVAVSMGVAVDTVKTHIKHIYEKMSVCNREQFFAKAALFDLY
jgi:DNA-binding CsgD family transcriptional regulator